MIPLQITLENALLDFETNLQAVQSTLIPEIITYTKSFGVALVILYIGIKVIQLFINPDSSVVPHTMVRPLLTLAALVLYNDLYTFLLETPTNFIEGIIESAAASAGIAGYEQASYDTLTWVQETGGSLATSKGIYDIIAGFPLLEVIHIVIYFIASVAGGYILFMSILTSQIYLVMGTLVLPLAIVPGNSSILSRWFFGFLAVMLWPAILKIIQIIIAVAYAAGSGGTGGTIFTQGFDDALFSVAFQVAMIFMVFKVPSFATMLVGEGADVVQGISGSSLGSGAKSIGVAGMGLGKKAMKSLTGKGGKSSSAGGSSYGR